jgi:hypothetical protein
VDGEIKVRVSVGHLDRHRRVGVIHHVADQLSTDAEN